MRIVPLKLNRKPQMTTWVVDNFYADPIAVRNFALKQEFVEEKDYYKGCRTKHQYFLPGTKEAFEKIMGIQIREWNLMECVVSFNIALLRIVLSIIMMDKPETL